MPNELKFVNKEALLCYQCVKDLRVSGILGVYKERYKIHINNWFKEKQSKDLNNTL